jgi:hypothetical protein
MIDDRTGSRNNHDVRVDGGVFANSIREPEATL